VGVAEGDRQRAMDPVGRGGVKLSKESADAPRDDRAGGGVSLPAA
jgi:hypothetical protein